MFRCHFRDCKAPKITKVWTLYSATYMSQTRYMLRYFGWRYPRRLLDIYGASLLSVCLSVPSRCGWDVRRLIPLLIVSQIHRRELAQ